MTYQQFLKILGDLGVPPYKYLPDIFAKIIDDYEYTLEDLAEDTGKSVITLRRYCTNGQVKYQSKYPYIVKGIDIKEKLFQEQLPSIKGQLKLISHLYDKIQLLLELLGEDNEDIEENEVNGDNEDDE